MESTANKYLLYIKQNYFRLLGFAFLIWFILSFLIVPNLQIIYKSFYSSNTGFSFDLFRKLLDSPNAVQGIKNSFILAFSLIITSNILGIFIVLIVDYFDIKGSKFLRLGYMTTFIYQGIVLISGYMMVYGYNGLITKFLVTIFPNMDTNWFVGYGPVLFVMTMSTTTIHMMFLTNAIKAIDNFTIEASRNLGASTFYTIRKVVLPTVLPTLSAITILQFLVGLGALAAPQMIGGRDFRTIAPLIFALNKIPGSQGLAIVLSMILGLVTVILIFMFSKLEKGGTYFSISKTKAAYVKQKIHNKYANVVVHLLAYLVFLIYVVPVVLIVLFSFTNAQAIQNVSLSSNSFTLENYTRIFSSKDLLTPFFNSIEFSLQASILVVVIVLIGIALTRKAKPIIAAMVEYSFLIPWMLPGTLIAIALLTTYSRPNLLIMNKVLIGTSTILILAYIIIRMPFTSRLLKAAFSSLDEDYIKAAKTLGASPLYAFRRITFPMIFPTLVALVALGFNSLLSEYNIAAFLAHPLKQPLGIVIYSFTNIESTGDTQAFIFVFSVILMIISITVITLVYGVILNEDANTKIEKWKIQIRKKIELRKTK